MTPTAEGLKRYPHTQGHYEDEPCTCEASCHTRCAGECGCDACQFAYVEFLDVAGLHTLDGLSVTDEEALRLYRSSQVSV